MIRLLLSLMIGALVTASQSAAQNGPLRIEIDQGVIEPLPFAVPDFVPASAAASDLAKQVARVVAEDLSGTGLFREIPASAYVSRVRDFAAPVNYEDWKVINAQALITGSAKVSGSNLTVQFRVYDVFSGAELGAGLQFTGPTAGWRRMAVIGEPSRRPSSSSASATRSSEASGRMSGLRVGPEGAGTGLPKSSERFIFPFCSPLLA